MFRKNEVLRFVYNDKPRLVQIITSKVGPNGRYVTGRDFGTDPSGPIKSFNLTGGFGHIQSVPDLKNA